MGAGVIASTLFLKRHRMILFSTLFIHVTKWDLVYLDPKYLEHLVNQTTLGKVTDF